MAFRSVGSMNLARFNSSTSCEFLEAYESFRDNQIQESILSKPHQTFAPSSFRCDRRSWFRLRGTDPDKLKAPDKILDFTAKIGTACHRIIQSDLRNMLKGQWIAVKDFLAANPIPYDYEIEEDKESGETKVSIKSPPINFAVDGIILWNNEYYLLEIKTSEYNSFKDLANPKDEHLDQVKCYATMLGISKVLFLYEDRLYGELKCYEIIVKDIEKIQIKDRMNYVLKCVDANIAPDRLPSGDKWCNNCPYSIKCKQWG